jgi:hypothetical protein
MSPTEIVSGFEATIRACEKLGLDLSTINRGTLQIFYNSGQAFSESVGAMTEPQKQLWRNSVIWPKQHESAEPDSRPKLPPIIVKPRGRPRNPTE